MKNRKLRYLIIGVVVIALYLSLKVITDHRERNLVDLINYKPTDFHSLGFIKDIRQVPENKFYEWFTTDNEPTDELMEFLSQYRVKKINEEKFNESLNEVEKFDFTITHLNANPAIVFLYEESAHIAVGNYYEIVNGPTDMEWVRNYHEKHRELYE